MAEIKKNYFQKKTKDRGPRFNNRISSPEVQVITNNGNNLGILSTNEAIMIAKREGLDSLSTEASLISYGLFLKNEWEIIRKEKVIINNIFFERYKMTKIIKVN